MVDLLHAVVSRYGRIALFAHDTGAVSQSVRFYGEWAENELSFLHNFISVGSTVVDVGAYIGTHTLAFAKFVGDEGTVVALEPQQATFDLLTKNLAENNIKNVLPKRAVVGSIFGRLDIPSIDPTHDESFGSASLKQVTLGISPATGLNENVSSLTIDSLELQQCSFIKLDVEGMEEAVIAGARHTIEKFEPAIYAECNSVAEGVATLSILRSFDYYVKMHVVDAYNTDNFLGVRENIFGAAREVALVGVSARNKGILSSIKPRPCELLLDIETADDLVLGLLNKPQYQGEVLRHSKAAKSGGALWIEVHRRDLQLILLDEIAEGLSSTQSLAVNRQDELVALSKRLDETDEALSSAQSLAVNRQDELVALSKRLDETAEALSSGQSLAINRQNEIIALSKRLDETAEALSSAQSLAVKRQNELVALSKRLDEKDEALSSAQSLAVNRQDGLVALSKRLDETAEALSSAQSLAITRQNEIIALSKRLDETAEALSSAQSLAIERQNEIVALGERLENTDNALSEAQFLAVARQDELTDLRQRYDETDRALEEAQKLATKRAHEIEALLR